MADTNFLKSASKPSAPSEKKNQKRGVRNLFRRKELGVNLMSPDIVREVTRQIERKNVIQILISFLVACALVGVSYLGIFIYGYFNAKNLKPIQDRLSTVNQEISSLELNSPALAAFQNTLSALAILLSDHIYWTRFLDQLEAATLKDVKYESLSVSTASNSLTLNGVAPSYLDIGKQIRAFQNASSTFPTVSVGTANSILDQGGQVTGVNFTLSLTVNLDIIKGLGNGTSTSQ
ncbi:hypothetical protein HY621_03100 [Candidatus Uhrbacteria bacterium]|nr:hypothetical protein [Candidatus Uhrbacteria bacterium]